jgi:hypothetical protein
MEKRSCPFCGKPISASLNRCPFCREAVPQEQMAAVRSGSSPKAGVLLRRGLLCALLAGVIYYFASGASGLKLPVEVPPFVNVYLTPLLFVAGAAMALYGLFLSLKG